MVTSYLRHISIQRAGLQGENSLPQKDENKSTITCIGKKKQRSILTGGPSRQLSLDPRSDGTPGAPETPSSSPSSYRRSSTRIYHSQAFGGDAKTPSKRWPMQ